jgi:hypothetical protein
MAKTIVIKALNGLRIPRPESSYRYVEGDEPVEVDVSTFDNLVYWTRRIDHGECVQLDEAETKAHLGKAAALRADEEAAETKAREELAAKQAAPAIAPAPTPVVQTPAKASAPAPVIDATPPTVDATPPVVDATPPTVTSPSDDHKQGA